MDGYCTNVYEKTVNPSNDIITAEAAAATTTANNKMAASKSQE